jgi:hypothetical protein
VPNPTLNDDPMGISPPGHTVVDTRGLFVLHAALLRTGKLLVFCGHVEGNFYAPRSYVFDPKNPGTPLTPILFPALMDLFCCHYVQIPDGRILVVGGSDMDFSHHSSVGAKNICIFDPASNSWAVSRNGGVDNLLVQGRWYPTPVLLPDGRVLVCSGRPEMSGGQIADKLEIISQQGKDQNNWVSTEQRDAAFQFPIYPGLHLAPDGRIYFTGTTWGQEIPNPDTMSILVPDDPATSTRWKAYPGPPRTHPAQARREEGMSVLLPPAQDGKILLIGGTQADRSDGTSVMQGGPHFGAAVFHHIEAASDCFSAEILDTKKDPPEWSAAPGGGTTSFGRTNGHCVLLPDATVLIVGGHNGYKWQAASKGTTSSLVAEIFTPLTGFRTVAAMTEPRRYHSVALLLPDGRVFVAGGADPDHGEPTLPWPPGWDPNLKYDPYAVNAADVLGYDGDALNNKTFEFYQPPYCFKGTRPKITDVKRNGNSTRRIEYKQSFKVTTAEAANIDKVAFMRPNAPTHHTDSEQRYVRLDFTKGAGELSVTAVADSKVAPPGYYMLWIVDTQGRPCEEAVFIQLVPRGSSCFIATAALGSPQHPGVVFLQELRQEIKSATRGGRLFIQFVNRIYESFSPHVAEYLIRNESAREAVRQWMVRPVVKAISVADKLTRRLTKPAVRHTTLLPLLILEAALGVVAAPFVVTAIGLRMLLRKHKERPDENSEVDHAS